jgi:heat shock protein HslJ
MVNLSKSGDKKMKKTPMLLMFLFVVFGLMLAACGSAPSLAGTTWKLVSYGSIANPTPAVPDVETSLTFGDDGQINGSMGCNSFFGGYKTKDAQITFDTIGSTMMACDDPRMQQESTVFGLLTGTLNFKMDGDTLTISSSNGASALVFKK